MSKPTKFCGICSELPEENSKVSCNGPCGKAFHALCVNVNNALLKDGMLWFCQTCRLNSRALPSESSLQATIQKLFGEIQKLAAKVDYIEGNAKLLKRVGSSVPGNDEVVDLDTADLVLSVQEKNDPRDGIWGKVFQNLSVADLCQARLVSSQWQKIIDQDRLLIGKFVFKFRKGINIDRKFRAVAMPPVSMVAFEDAAICAVGSWWSPSITKNLVDLRFDTCFISLTNLLTMLQYTPNLVTLNLGCGSSLIYKQAVKKVPHFQLEKMEKLTVDSVQQDEVMRVFSRVFPRLRTFSLLSEYEQCHQGMLEMMDNQPCLEEISLISYSYYLSHLLRVNHQFKRVTIETTFFEACLEENLISFSQKQPLLECFNLRVRHLTYGIDGIPPAHPSIDLTAVLRNLPSLKRMSIDIDSYSAPGSNIVFDLQPDGYLTELEHLTSSGNVNLRQSSPNGAGIPKLKELRLRNMNAATNPSGVRDHIVNAPNLRILNLYHCTLNSWSDLFESIQSQGLRRLTLESVRATTTDDVGLSKNLEELRSLDLRKCEMSEQILSTLFELCPQLEELYLTSMENLTDDVVLLLVQNIKQLQKLSISGSTITDVSASHISDHGRNLEQLTIKNCKKLTKAGIAQLKSAKIEKIKLE